MQSFLRRDICKNCKFLCASKDNYCPNCGQLRSVNILEIREFLAEVFKGFLSWDAKFWHTIIPLLFRPGRVSKNYVAGKRNYYTNPFRFYFTVSIIFFFLLGFLIKKTNYNGFSNNNSDLAESPAKNNETDSLKIHNKSNEQEDGTLAKKEDPKDFVLVEFMGYKYKMIKFIKFINYAIKHPEESTHQALKKMNLELTFGNVFWYNKAVFYKKMVVEEDPIAINVFEKQIISYTSISLFVLLPFFALLLKLFYCKQNRKYMEHLIFTFHTQTFFFLLFFLVVLLNELKFISADNLFLGAMLLFLAYLYKSFKTFYQQKHIITVVKFTSINFCVFLVALFGLVGIFLVSFLLH